MQYFGLPLVLSPVIIPAVKQLDSLVKRGLVDLHGKDGREGYRPNKHFRKIWRSLFKNDYDLREVNETSTDLADCLANFSPQICVLSIDGQQNELDTIFLLPQQTHIGLYVIIANKKITWSYFTTDQAESNILIASNQPFGDDINKRNRPQLLHLLSPTIILENNCMPLHVKTIEEANNYLSYIIYMLAIYTLYQFT